MSESVQVDRDALEKYLADVQVTEDRLLGCKGRLKEIGMTVLRELNAEHKLAVQNLRDFLGLALSTPAPAGAVAGGEEPT